MFEARIRGLGLSGKGKSDSFDLSRSDSISAVGDQRAGLEGPLVQLVPL